MVNAFRAGHDRGRPGRGGRLVHGAAPPELRRTHAGRRVLPRRRRRHLAGGERHRRLLRRQHRRRPGDRPGAPVAGRAVPAARSRRSSARSRPSPWPAARCSSASTAASSTASPGCCSARSSVCPTGRSSPWRWWPSSCSSAIAALGRPLLFATVDRDVAVARGVPVRALSVAFLAGARLHGGRGEPDHRRPAGVRPAGHAGRRRPAAHRPARSLGLCLAVGVRAGRGVGWPWRVAFYSTVAGRASSCRPSVRRLPRRPAAVRLAPDRWTPPGQPAAARGAPSSAPPGMAGA